MAVELPDGRCESNDVLEALRLRAVHARELGYAVIDIATILGVREETVSRWCSRYDRGGRAALPGDRTGRPIGSGRLLDEGHEQGIREAIETKTPQELGIPSALWTRQAVRELIHQRVSIRLPIRTVGEYLRRWGYTPQKPVRKAYRQDPKAVAEWLEKTYPTIEKRAAQEGGEIHWGDETGVRSTCQHSRGYARPGATPELIVPGTRFSVNMISTVTNQGKVRWMIYPGKMNAALFLVFLTRLIAGATKKVFLSVDHLSVHEAAAVDQWLADKTDRIEVFCLPKYAPERNPDEYLNCDLKANINTDGLPKDRQELQGKLRRFMHRLAKLPARIASYFEHKYIEYAAVPELTPT
ncbi:MAG TPA: IS630 family transposase [Candidatus Acidoferrum sp.]|nr:IS630 family transposase [Candidatus Acidoferrum sp.]